MASKIQVRHHYPSSETRAAEKGPARQRKARDCPPGPARETVAGPGSCCGQCCVRDESPPAPAGPDSDYLVTCSVCGGSLSRFADSCPHCGDPGPRGDLFSLADGCFWGMFRGMIALLLLYGLVSAALSALLKSCGLS